MKKPLLKHKRCPSCLELFTPNPKNKNLQRHCSKANCQAVRQRQNEENWCKNNPDVVKQYKSKWQKKHPDYSCQKRAANPALAQKNRQDTKARMQKMRKNAMFDKNKSILTQVIGRNTDNLCLMRGRWIFLCLTGTSAWTRALVMRHTSGIRLKRIANRLPRSRLYDLSGILKGGSGDG